MSTEVKKSPITAVLDTLKEKINSILKSYPQIDEPIKKVEAALGGKIDKAYIVVAIVVIPLIIILVGGVGHLLIDLIGFIYPAYQSIKAIESKEKGDDTLWLTYWLIFALFKIVEGVADVILSTIPFYVILKGVFLVWCYHPKSQGAQSVYTTVVKGTIAPLLGIKAEEEKKAN